MTTFPLRLHCLATVALTGALLLAACAGSDSDADDDGAGGAGATSGTATGSGATGVTGSTASVTGGVGATTGVSSTTVSASSSGAASSSSSGTGGAAPTGIVFDLRTLEPYPEGTIASLEAAAFTITRDGLSATFTANQGVLNQTTGSFGVNSDGSADASALIDGGAGSETVTVTFSANVTVLSVYLTSFSSEDAATVNIADDPLVYIEQGLTTDLGGASLPAGEGVVVGIAAGNGFSFDRITVALAP